MKRFFPKVSKLALYCFCFVFCNASLYGQDFVILPSGEQMVGTISRSFDFSHYNSIEFISLTGQKYNFSPEDINGFQLDNGRQFSSLLDPISSKKLFFQRLVNGRLSLLSHEKLFYIHNGEELIRLEKADKKALSQKRVTTVVDRKPYIAILNILTSENCGFKLRDQIEATTYHEQSFIEIIKSYHECEGNPHEVVIEQIPAKKISPYIMVGLATLDPVVNNLTNNKIDGFESAISPLFVVGLKGFQFRHRTRAGFDAGLGFTQQLITINSVLEGRRNFVTGTEKIKARTFFAPLFFNYSIIKSPMTETYIGLGGMVSYSFHKSDFAILDISPPFSSTIQLVEQSYVKRQNFMISPSIKLGTHFKHNNSIGFLLELQTGYSPQNYTIDIEESTSIYSELHSSILFGIRF